MNHSLETNFKTLSITDYRKIEVGLFFQNLSEYIGSGSERSAVKKFYCCGTRRWEIRSTITYQIKMMYEINVIKCKLDLNTKQILQYNDCATTKNWNMYNSFGSPLSCIIIPEGNSVQANIFLFYITHVCIWKLSSLAEHDQFCDKQTNQITASEWSSTKANHDFLPVSY